MVACIVYTWVLLSFSAFHSHLGPVTLIESERKWLFNVKYLAVKQETINFFDHFTVFHIHLPGVVGGTSLTSMLHLFILFCTASSLGCFSTIVFIGAGVISRSFAAASVRSLLLAFR